MSGFNAIIGQRLPIRLLQTFRTRGAIPHAMLFTGMPGIGKRTVARFFAMALNCRSGGRSAQCPATDEKPCGGCRQCQRIASGNHPDVLLIEPQGGILRIDQIRRLIALLAMKPFEEGCRVVIVDDAQALNPEASNALLKVLEEPPDRTILILLAPHRSDLLATIVSRCRHIRFNPLPADELASFLTRHYGVEAELAQAVSQLSGGSVAEALRLLQTPWQAHRDWLVRAAGLDENQSDPKRTPEAALAFAGALSARKGTIHDDLTLLKGWVRDLWIVPHAAGQTFNRDCEARLQRARTLIGSKRLDLIWDAIDKAQKAIAANANLRLTLDVMALKMAGINAD